MNPKYKKLKNPKTPSNTYKAVVDLMLNDISLLRPNDLQGKKKKIEIAERFVVTEKQKQTLEKIKQRLVVELL